MKVVGLTIVRDEEDLVRLSILHHLALGLDEVLVVNDGSRDGTARVLAGLARRHPIRVTLCDEGFHRQGSHMTRLAREAHAEGADWVVPFDADELLVTTGRPLKVILGGSRAHALRVEVVNFIQERRQRRPTPRALLRMTRRVAEPVGPLEDCEALVDSERIAFVEMAYPSKWLSRPTPAITIAMGAHHVSGLAGPGEDTAELTLLHAPLRARETLDVKASRALALPRVEGYGHNHWHLRRFLRLRAAGRLEAEWEANSHAGGFLGVGDRKRPLVEDTRLREAVAPHVRTWLRWW